MQNFIQNAFKKKKKLVAYVKPELPLSIAIYPLRAVETGTYPS